MSEDARIMPSGTEVVSGEVVDTANSRDLRADQVEATRSEDAIVKQLRKNAEDAGEVENKLLHRLAEEATPATLPAAARAAAEIRTKSIDNLLRMTGRGIEPDQSVLQIIESMTKRGFIKVNVEMTVGASPDPDPSGPSATIPTIIPSEEA